MSPAPATTDTAPGAIDHSPEVSKARSSGTGRDFQPMSFVDPERTLRSDRPAIGSWQKLLTLLLVIGPAVALVVCTCLLWGHAVNLTDVLMGTIFYFVTGLGITIGYHRLFAHRGFKSRRVLKIVLALVGSMAIEGSVTSWVATHRRHHLYSDHDGDPHSPHRYGDQGQGLLRGLIFAHVGWLFVSDASCAERYAPDTIRDADIRTVGRLFPVLAVCSLALPFGLGYVLSGTLIGAITALVWAGLLRMTLLHHVTWSINSLCHTFGQRSEETADQSTNLRILAIPSLGESWHNIHHAHPTWARHGAGRGMVDPSARIIWLFERFGWVTNVRWPRTSFAAPA